MQAAQQETVQFDRSILDENVYTASLDQRLPYLPLTLHTADSLTDDAVRLLPAQDKDTGLMNASVDWKLLAEYGLLDGLAAAGGDAAGFAARGG